MRMQLQLTQVQQITIEDLMQLFGSDSILSYSELVERALSHNWTRNDFTKNLIEAKALGFVKEWFEGVMGYFYELETMLNY
jgi:hypothetical protein